MFEALESRCLMAADTAPAVELMTWDGREVQAFSERYVVRMPSIDPAGVTDLMRYQSAAPDLRPGWSSFELGAGYFSVVTPGASVQDVSAWATEAGVISLSPDEVLHKQAVLHANDSYYRRYLWGLDNTGELASPSVETIAARDNDDYNDGPFPRVRNADIGAPEAWGGGDDPIGTTGSKSIIIAVMDDGIDHMHPDLAPNMWVRPSNVPLFNPATPSVFGVGTFGFNSAEWLANGLFDRPENNFFATQPGALAGKEEVPLDPEGDGQSSMYSRWRGANDSHGTHVAGIIGAKGNNGIGVTGVAWDVQLYSANIFQFGNYEPHLYNGFYGEKWFSAGGAGATLTGSNPNDEDDPRTRRALPQARALGSVSAFVDAAYRLATLRLVHNQPIVAANCSFMTYNGESRAPLQIGVNLLEQAGILVIAAAGNGFDPCTQDGVGDNLDVVTCPPEQEWGPVWPASLTNANIITVAASTAEDKLARFSNWGPISVDIAAPGDNIWSTIPNSASYVHLGVTKGRWAAAGLSEQLKLIEYDTREPYELPPTLDADELPAPRPLMYRHTQQRMIEYSPGQSSGANGGYASMSGTSMAAGYVSGAAAILASDFLRLTGSLPSAQFLKTAILASRDPVTSYVQDTPVMPPRDIMYNGRAYIENDPHPGVPHVIRTSPVTGIMPRLNV